MENTDREKEIQKLCNGVLDTSPNVYYNPNGADETTCPFCIRDVKYAGATMEAIPHYTDCAYLIAKDLTTNTVKYLKKKDIRPPLV